MERTRPDPAVTALLLRQLADRIEAGTETCVHAVSHALVRPPTAAAIAALPPGATAIGDVVGYRHELTVHLTGGR